MAVPAIDAATEANGRPFNHTPSGTPIAVILSISKRDVGTDDITGATYGGVAMIRLAFAGHTGSGEDGCVTYYGLFSGIPAGTQSVTTTGLQGGGIHYVCMTIAGPPSVEVVSAPGSTGFGSSGSVNLAHQGRDCLDLATIACGDNNLPAPGSGMTLVHDHDYGVYATSCYRCTTVGTADKNMSWSWGGGANGYAIAGIALAEQVPVAKTFVTIVD